MRSPLALAAFVGCVARFPKTAQGKLVPYYIYRDPPTATPTSTPSYQPSLQPSLQPSSQPSSAPTTSMPPSSLRRKFLATDGTSSSIEFWLTLSLIGILICLVCVGSKRSRKSPCLPCICGDENTQDKVEEGDGWGWSAWPPSFWSSDKPSKPPRPVAKKKTFLSRFSRSDAQVSPTASSRRRKSHKKPKRYEHSDEDSIGHGSFGSFWSSGQTANPPPPVVKKKKTFSSVLKRPDAQVSPTTTRPKHKRTSHRTAGDKGRARQARHHRQRDERDEEKKRFPSLFGRSDDVPRIVSSSSRKNHKKPKRRVEGGKGRVREHRQRDRRTEVRKGSAARSPRYSRKRQLNDKYDVESTSGIDLDLDSSRRTKRRDDKNKRRVVQQRTEEVENAGTETWGQALVGLVGFGNQTKEVAETTGKGKQNGDGGRKDGSGKLSQALPSFVAFGDRKREFQEDSSSSKFTRDCSDQQRTLQTEESEPGSAVRGKFSHTLPKFNVFGWRKDYEENTNEHSGSGGDDNTSGSPWPWQNSTDHDYSNQDTSRSDVPSCDKDYDNDGNSSHSSSCSGSYSSYPRHWGDSESEDEESASCESIVESFSSSESSKSWGSV